MPISIGGRDEHVTNRERVEVKRVNRREHPLPADRWGVYNMGNLWAVYRTKKQARSAAEKWVGNDWKVIQSFMEIHRVTVQRAAKTSGKS